MPIARDTGFPGNDAQDDFLRARRRRVFARLSAKLRLAPGDVDLMLAFDEVVDALGRVAERDLGVTMIAVDSMSGASIASRSSTARSARRRRACGCASSGSPTLSAGGASMPPVDVYRVGELHFVRDGHHRVAVARAQGRDDRRARRRGHDAPCGGAVDQP